MKQKLQSKAGVSFAELLVTILILLMVSSVVAGGIPVAKNVYDKVVLSANAQTVLSTAVTALRSELALAKDISKVDSGKTISYTSANNLNKIGSNSKIFCDETQGIMLQEYISYDETAPDQGKRRLISKSASPIDLAVFFDTVTFSDDIVRFSTIEVKNGTGQVFASLDELDIHVVLTAERGEKDGSDT